MKMSGKIWTYRQTIAFLCLALFETDSLATNISLVFQEEKLSLREWGDLLKTCALQEVESRLELLDLHLPTQNSPL